MAEFCPCHDVPMLWEKDGRKKRGGVWRCRVKKDAARVAYNNSEARRATNARRMFIGSHYIGTERDYPYPREVVERHLLGLWEEHKAKQAAEDRAFRAALEAVPATASLRGRARYSEEGAVISGSSSRFTVTSLRIRFPSGP